MMQIDVQDLVFSYGGADVLQGVSFCADKGERIAVLGPNGVGKSTLFRCLLGFLEPKRGCVKIAGRDVQAYSRRALAAELAYIPQSYHPIFDHTVLESVLMGLSAQLGTFDRPSRAQAARAMQILSELGIAQLAERGCTRISGGERQLMLLGRALMQNAHTLIMDEPTASLDYGNSFRVMQRIESLSAGGYSVIFSTHEPNQAFRYATKVLALKNGRVLAFGPPADVLTPELLEALYGSGSPSRRFWPGDGAFPSVRRMAGRSFDVYVDAGDDPAHAERQRAQRVSPAARRHPRTEAGRLPHALRRGVRAGQPLGSAEPVF